MLKRGAQPVLDGANLSASVNSGFSYFGVSSSSVTGDVIDCDVDLPFVTPFF